MEQAEGDVWCEIHCCIHDENDDPYNYGYWATEEEPECGPVNWRILWIGKAVAK